jgi:phenylalanyl-tRNA synthetase beta chain
MGGENTEVSDATTSVGLETANFEPLTVIKSGERHRMRSEAQTRWEKGVDPEAAALAATYASQLLAELAGARWTGETEVRAEPAAPTVIAAYRPQYASASVGLEIPEDEQRTRRAARLRGHRRLDGPRTDLAGARRTPRGRRRGGGRALPPRRRAGDPADTAGDVRPADARTAPAALRRRRARRRWMYEAYTYSLQHGDPDPNALELPEPLSSQQRVLRTTLAVGLLGAAKHNLDMGNDDVALFELAHVYLPPGPVPEERWRLGGIVQGDFRRAQGLVETVFGRAAHRAGLSPTPSLHTNRSRRDGAVGLVGTYARGSCARSANGARSSFLDLDELFALVPERDRVPRRHHLSATSPGSRVRRR